MKAARLFKIGDFRVEEIEKPVPHGKELLVKVAACGICGSDIPRIFELGTSKQKYPLTIGHEFAGTVVAVGEDADKNLIGKKGAIFPLIPCRKCGPCLMGEYVMCEDYDYMGSRCDGGFAEYCLVPSDWHFVESKSDKVSLTELAMTEPCTVAQHAVRKGEVTCGNYVAIFGSGPIGMMAARWCKLFGAKPLLFDVVDEKIKFCTDRGLEAVNNMTNDPVEAIKKFTGGKLCDVCIEGTGSGAALGQAIECVKSMGTIVLMGNPSKDTQIKISQHSKILRKELTIKGIWNSHFSEFPINEWTETVEKIGNGQMLVKDLITHKVDIDNLPKLCEDIHDRKVNICKAMYESKD